MLVPLILACVLTKGYIGIGPNTAYRVFHRPNILYLPYAISVPIEVSTSMDTLSRCVSVSDAYFPMVMLQRLQASM